MSLKKFLIGVSCTVFILGGGYALSYYVFNFSFNDIISKVTLLVDGGNLDDYTKNNYSSFVPMDIDGKLKSVDLNSLEEVNVSLLNNNDIISINFPSSDYFVNHSDTVFDKNGSFYAVLSNDTSGESISDSLVVKENYLGRNRPAIFEVRFPNMDSVLYIQCYSNEVYSYFKNYNWENVSYRSNIDSISGTDDDIAYNTEIPDNIRVSNSDSYLNDDLLYIVNNYRDEYEGYTDIHEYNSMSFNYYRVVGLLDTEMKVEYAKMNALGYNALEYGNYKGVSYILYDDFVILGSNVTNNSVLLHYVNF